MAEKTLVETLKYDRIRTGAMIPTLHYDEEHVKYMAEAGIDFITLLLDDVPEEERKPFFEYCAKYGIEIAVTSAATKKYYNQAGMFDCSKIDNAWFKDEPAFTFYYFSDEMGTEHYDATGEAIREFKKVFPDKRPYINLLPMYANSAQLTGGAWKAPIEYFETPTTDYQQYLDEYVAKVDTDYISVDIYPCHRVEKPECPEKFPVEYIPTTYGGYVRNIEMVADVCRQSGRDFWAFIQTCSWNKWIREVNEAEIRWQAYTMLAFGAKAILYYIFAALGSHTGTAFNVRGDKTQTFFDIQRMGMGLHKLSDVFVQYKNLGAYSVNRPETMPWLDMANPYKDFDTIKALESDTPLLVGCFEKKEGNGNAFVLVNYQDFREPKTSTIKFKADGKITYYYDGEPEVLKKDADGWYQVQLTQGDGAFVTVE